MTFGWWKSTLQLQCKLIRSIGLDPSELPSSACVNPQHDGLEARATKFNDYDTLQCLNLTKDIKHENREINLNSA